MDNNQKKYFKVFSPLFPKLSLRVIIASLVLFIVGTFCLYYSYYMTNSNAWEYIFNRCLIALDLKKENVALTMELPNMGFFIEFMRLIIILMGFALLLGHIFNDEFKQLFGFGLLKKNVGRSQKIWYWLVILSYIFILLWILQYNATMPMYFEPIVGRSGPEKLHANWLTVHDKIDTEIYPEIKSVSVIGFSKKTEGFNEYFKPYVFYTGYQIVCFIGIALPLIIVSLYVLILDRSRLIKQSKDIEAVITEQSVHTEDKFKEYEEKVVKYDRFTSEYISIVGRYSILALFLFVVILYENKLGYKTITPYSRFLTYLAVIFTGLSLSIFGFIIVYYNWIFTNTWKYFVDKGITIVEFEKNYKTISVVTRIFSRHFVFYIIITLVGVIFPHLKFLKDLFL